MTIHHCMCLLLNSNLFLFKASEGFLPDSLQTRRGKMNSAELAMSRKEQVHLHSARRRAGSGLWFASRLAETCTWTRNSSAVKFETAAADRKTFPENSALVHSETCFPRTRPNRETLHRRRRAENRETRMGEVVRPGLTAWTKQLKRNRKHMHAVRCLVC